MVTTASCAQGSHLPGGSLPPVVLHHEAIRRLELCLLEYKSFALVPAPGLFVLANTAQIHFIRHLRAREGEQLPPERLPLMGGPDEQHVEIEFWHMQRQHRGDGAVVVGDEQAPA